MLRLELDGLSAVETIERLGHFVVSQAKKLRIKIAALEMNPKDGRVLGVKLVGEVPLGVGEGANDLALAWTIGSRRQLAITLRLADAVLLVVQNDPVDCSLGGGRHLGRRKLLGRGAAVTPGDAGGLGLGLGLHMLEDGEGYLDMSNQDFAVFGGGIHCKIVIDLPIEIHVRVRRHGCQQLGSRRQAKLIGRQGQHRQNILGHWHHHMRPPRPRYCSVLDRSTICSAWLLNQSTIVEKNESSISKSNPAWIASCRRSEALKTSVPMTSKMCRWRCQQRTRSCSFVHNDRQSSARSMLISAARYEAFHTRYSQYGMMMASPDVHIPAGPSCADFEEENFEPSKQSQNDDQKFFFVDENNYGTSADEAKDTPCTVPLDDVSIIESEIDLGASLEESNSKQVVDLEVGTCVSGGDENDTQSHNGCVPRIMTTITPIPTEHAIDPPTVIPAADVERRIDNSYTVTWSAVARGEKWCGTVLPRFFWLMVLLCLIAVLCASVGYIVYSLQLLQ